MITLNLRGNRSGINGGQETGASAVVQALNDDTTIGHEYELGGPDVLTMEQIERRTLEAIGVRRWFVPFPLPLLRVVVALMELILPNPPVTRSLLELLQVSNVTSENSLSRFVRSPRRFTVEHIAPYMRQFEVADTIRQYLGR